MQKPIRIAGVTIKPGHRQAIDIPLPSFYTRSSVNMPVHVVHGREAGPVLLISAAVHGDEINGIEIIRRLLGHKSIDRIKGTLIAIPVVNVYGFVSKSRYLPDRRDLNRSFPGSESGSMAARLAHVLMTEILPHCNHIIDLHTGAVNRENLPQIRAKLRGDAELETLARAFGVPVIVNAEFPQGSFRAAAKEMGISVLLYEAGEALRFDEVSIRAGVQGVLQVMAALGMRRRSSRKQRVESMVANRTRWVRAAQSGILRALVATGMKVEEGELLAYIDTPLGEHSEKLVSPVSGIIIGKTNLPLVFAGEALFNIAGYDEIDQIAENIDAYQDQLDPSTDQIQRDEPPLV